MALAGSSLEFRNLPLVGVTIRAYLSSPIPIDIRFINDLHGLLKDEFPNASILSALEASTGLGPETQLSIRAGDLPGVAFTGNIGVSVQLQRQLLAVRWGHGPSEHAADYPRYPKLRSVFDTTFQNMARLVSDQLKVAITNMSYVNLVRSEDPRSYLKDEYTPRATSSTDKSIQEQVVGWREPTGIDLRFEIRGIERILDGEKKEAAFLLTTVAGKRLGNADEVIPNLDGNHDALQNLFGNLISDRAKTEWGFLP